MSAREGRAVLCLSVATLWLWTVSLVITYDRGWWTGFRSVYRPAPHEKEGGR